MGIYFITGVNGVGKSTIIPILKNKLDSSRYEIHDFDERGVPAGAGSEWRLSETLYWAELGKENLEKGISTVICGFEKAKEIQEAERQLNITLTVCLLDASPETIAMRLTERHSDDWSLSEMTRITGKTPEKFIEDNIWVSQKFREEAEQFGYKIIDTSNLTPEEVVGEMVEWF